MGTDSYCFLETIACNPIAWWAAAGAWFQAIATVATFIWALVIQRTRDAREQNVRERAELKDKISSLHAQTAVLRADNTRMRRETAFFNLQLVRYARTLRDSIQRAVHRKYQSAFEELLAYTHLLRGSADGNASDALYDPSAGAELSETGIHLVMAIESMADSCRVFTVENVNRLTAEQAQQFSDALRGQLEKVLQECGGIIEEIESDMSSRDSPTTP